MISPRGRRARRATTPGGGRNDDSARGWTARGNRRSRGGALAALRVQIAIDALELGDERRSPFGVFRRVDAAGALLLFETDELVEDLLALAGELFDPRRVRAQ